LWFDFTNNKSVQSNLNRLLAETVRFWSIRVVPDLDPHSTAHPREHPASSWLPFRFSAICTSTFVLRKITTP
jgi:hypothetical protein